MLRMADLVMWVSSKCTPKQLTLAQIIVKIAAIATSPCTLGEGPLWDHDRQRPQMSRWKTEPFDSNILYFCHSRGVTVGVYIFGLLE